MKSAFLIVLSTLALATPALRAAEAPSPTPTAVAAPPVLKPALPSPTPVPTLPPKLASDETVKQLLEVTRGRQLVDSIVPYLDQFSNDLSRRMSASKKLTAAQQAAFNAAVAKSMAEYRAEFTWEKLQPLYVDAYARTFTEEETKAIIAFYQTPAGQSLLTKLGGVMRSIMTSEQMQVQNARQRMQKDIMNAANQAIAAYPAPSPTPTVIVPKAGPTPTLAPPAAGPVPTPAVK